MVGGVGRGRVHNGKLLPLDSIKAPGQALLIRGTS